MDSLSKMKADCLMRASAWRALGEELEENLQELRPIYDEAAAEWKIEATRIEALMEQGAVKWPNYCNETVPHVLRFLARNERPIGGEDRYNSSHLEQLASEIERMASRPLYPAPQDCEEVRKELEGLREAMNAQRTTNATARAVESTLSALLEAKRQGEAAKQGAAAMRAALQKITDYVDSNTCRHEETHRGGAIWEIFDHCGEKWADDEGGRPEFVEPKELVDAREALSSDAGRDYVPAERLRKAEEELDCETRWAYELIEQRDIAEDSLAKAYSLVTDRTSEWSDYFGYTDAIIGIGEAMEQYKRDAERYSPEGFVGYLVGQHDGDCITETAIMIWLDDYRAMLNAVPEE